MPEENDQTTESRRNRVNRLKKTIIALIMLLVLVPYVVLVVLFLRMRDSENNILFLKDRMDQIAGEVKDNGQDAQGAENALSQLRTELETLKLQLEEERALREEQEKLLPQTSGKHRVYLTFDDGPSANTDEILDILAMYHVKATFFVVGKEDEVSRQRIQRIVSEGHTLGMHSYSHKYQELYESLESFTEDFRKMQDFLEGVTGQKCVVYRFPGGSSNTVSNVDMTELAQYLVQQGVTFYDWNISSGDANSRMPSVEKLIENATADIGIWENAVVLLHDTADKHRTVEALPGIIETILAMEDVEILPITDETSAVQHIHLPE